MSKKPLRFPTAQEPGERPPISNTLVARVQELIKKAAELCKGDDRVWDLWVIRHLGSPQGALNGFAGLPMATDAFMRGLHHGLKAHIPIESEEFAAKRNEFAAHVAKAMIRYAVCDAGGMIIARDGKGVMEAVERAVAGFKRLEELPSARPSEHPLVKAQRVMGEKLTDLRTAKNKEDLPNRQEVEREFNRLRDLYTEMFGAVFPG